MAVSTLPVLKGLLNACWPLDPWPHGPMAPLQEPWPQLSQLDFVCLKFVTLRNSGSSLLVFEQRGQVRAEVATACPVSRETKKA